LDNLQVGTFGWHRADSQGHFYPEDMPEEWQLDYYSNAFRVVLVPEALWMSWDADAIEDCVESVEGEFRFYLNIEQLVNEQKLAQIKLIKSGLGDLLKGLVLFSEASVPEPVIAGVAVSLVSKTQVMPGWQVTINDYQISGQPLGFCDQLSAEGKQQAALLKTFMSQVPEKSDEIAFFIGGDSINMNHVANLKVVGEFLGY